MQDVCSIERPPQHMARAGYSEDYASHGSAGDASPGNAQWREHFVLARTCLGLGLGEAEFLAGTAGMIAGGEGLALDGFGRVHAFAVGTLAGLF